MSTTVSTGSTINCSTIATSNNKKIVQLGQKLFHGEGHELILESHDESARNAFIYIGLILFVYLMAVIAIVVRYLLLRSNRDFMALTSSPRHLSKARRRNSGFTPLTTPSVVISPHVVRIEDCDTQRVLQETEL